MQNFGMTKSIMVCYGIFWTGQYRGVAASLDTEIATALTLQHTLHLGADMEACSHPIGS